MVASTAPEFDVRRTGSSRFMIWKTSFWSSGVYLQSKLSTSQRPNCAERSEEHFIERRGERVSKTKGGLALVPRGAPSAAEGDEGVGVPPSVAFAHFIASMLVFQKARSLTSGKPLSLFNRW